MLLVLSGFRVGIGFADLRSWTRLSTRPAQRSHPVQERVGGLSPPLPDRAEVGRVADEIHLHGHGRVTGTRSPSTAPPSDRPACQEPNTRNGGAAFRPEVRRPPESAVGRDPAPSRVRANDGPPPDRPTSASADALGRSPPTH